MRTMTRNERRAIKMELKRSKFSFDKLRIILDCSKRERFYLVGMNIFDDVNGLSQRICVPFKNDPDMERIKEQLENMPATVFYTPVEAENEPILRNTNEEAKPSVQGEKKGF